MNLHPDIGIIHPMEKVVKEGYTLEEMRALTDQMLRDSVDNLRKRLGVSGKSVGVNK